MDTKKSRGRPIKYATEEEKREHKAEYYRLYRAKKKEENAEPSQSHKENQKKYYDKNKDKYRAYYELNREKINERSKQRYKTLSDAMKNKQT